MNELLSSAESAQLLGSAEWRVPLEVLPLLVAAWTRFDVHMDQGVMNDALVDEGKVDSEGVYWSAREARTGDGIFIGRRPDYYTRKFNAPNEERFFSFETLRGLRLTLA